MQNDRPADGLRVGLDGLRASQYVKVPDENEDLVAHFKDGAQRFIDRAGGAKAGETLSALELNTNPEVEQAIEVISSITDVGVFIALDMVTLLAAQASNLSLDHGLSQQNPFLYFTTSIGIVKHLDAMPVVESIGDAANTMLVSGDYPSGRGWVGDLWYVYHWTHHPHEAQEWFDEALEATRREHDPLFTAYILNVAVVYHFLLGESMADVVRAQAKVEEHCTEFGLELSRGLTASLSACARALAGRTESIMDPNGYGYDLDQAITESRDINITMSITHSALTMLAALGGLATGTGARRRSGHCSVSYPA